MVPKEGIKPIRYFPPYDSYSYEPHPESGDRIASWKTRSVGSVDPHKRYAGDGWAVGTNEHYYQGEARTAVMVGQSVQLAFQGEGIYWRAIASGDAGKADVFIDDVLQKTVDCFFPECILPYAFAFLKSGLNPKRPHTIKVLVRGDKNRGSSGTKIRHIAFEHAAVGSQ